MSVTRVGPITFVGVAALVCAGCDLDVASGKFSCARDADCPKDFVCAEGSAGAGLRCYAERPTTARDAGPDADAGSDASADGGRDATDGGGTDARTDAASDAGATDEQALARCERGWKPAPPFADAGAGWYRLDTLEDGTRPSYQYLCRGTHGGAYYPGKITAETAKVPTQLDETCHLAVLVSATQWAPASSNVLDVFEKPADCTLRFEPMRATDDFPSNAFPASGSVGIARHYVCVAKVEAGQGYIQPSDGREVGMGKHIGTVDPADKRCRYEFYGDAGVRDDYEILVVD